MQNAIKPLMKAALLLGLFLPLAASAEPSAIYDRYDRLLERYASDQGVHYAEWQRNSGDIAELHRVVAGLEAVEPDTLSREERKAFWINLYNVGMLQLVFENYPLRSVTEIEPGFGVFKTKHFHVEGRAMSLDDIEKATLLKQWDDPRIHFGVNCASASCPPLRPEAFRAAELDQQLDEQTRLFANSPFAAKVDRSERTVLVSALFNWYKDDFPGNDPLRYLNRYREKPLPTNYEIKYQDYDWSLNRAPQ